MICNHDQHKFCFIHTEGKHCLTCCNKEEDLKIDVVFLCPFPCVNVSKEKPKHNCLRCGKSYYPIIFKKDVGWIGWVPTQWKYEKTESTDELLQKK